MASRSHRIHVLLHEATDPVEKRGDAIRRCEIHGRASLPAARAQTSAGAARRSGPWPRRQGRSRPSARAGRRGRAAPFVGCSPVSSSSSRAASAPACGTSTSRGPAARKSGHVEARACGAARSAPPPPAAGPGSTRPRPGCARPPRSPARPRCSAGSILRARPWASLSGLSIASRPDVDERHPAARRRRLVARVPSRPQDGQASSGDVEVVLLHPAVGDAPRAHHRGVAVSSETIR